MSERIALSTRELVIERRGSGFRLELDRLDLHAGEVLAILGPNGAGKTTLLRVLAGLEPSGGERIESADGPVTMVFQHPAAFSGTVAHNVRVALLRESLPAGEVRERTARVLERFGIAGLAERHAGTLSGGELRRLALARAFALRPAVLLLDEPFDDLDTAGQASLSLDLRAVIADTDVAVAMVTHDLRRALLLADRIAVLLDGRLVQAGLRDDVLAHPVSPEVAQLVGMSNLVPGVVSDDGRFLDVDAQHRVPLDAPEEPGRERVVGIRPEDLRVETERGTGASIGKGTVRSIVNDGVAVTLALDWAGLPLSSLALAGSGLARGLAVGDRVSLSVQPERVHVMPGGA